MTGLDPDGGTSPTESGPASEPSLKDPPRNTAPGVVLVSLAPARHISSLLKPPQDVQVGESGSQSATHSVRLPTMSKAPRADTQALRAPVIDTAPEALLQSVARSSGPGSGVPFAPTCH